MNKNITFCGVYWNEAQNVRRVLDWAKGFFADIIIAVQTSDDGTEQICAEYTTNILHHPPQSPEESKDEIMSLVKTPWAFWLDADEFPSKELMEELVNFNPDNFKQFDSIGFPRINYVDGFRIQVDPDQTDRQWKLLKNTVRWNVKKQSAKIHIPPMVYYKVASNSPIYHYRSFEKVDKRTDRWNELEIKTKPFCDKYRDDVRKELENVRSRG
jgi:hypothetical protein